MFERANSEYINLRSPDWSKNFNWFVVTSSKALRNDIPKKCGKIHSNSENRWAKVTKERDQLIENCEQWLRKEWDLISALLEVNLKQNVSVFATGYVN